VAVAQQVARGHPNNARLQEGVVELLDALERAEQEVLAEEGGAPPGWTPQAHAQWLALAAQLRSTFQDLSPDPTALYRMLDFLHANYHQLALIFRHYAFSGDGNEASVDNFLLDVREWNQFARTCKLATRAYDRAQITRVFLQMRSDCEGRQDRLTELQLTFGEFIEALVRVCFMRMNPFFQSWLLGTAADDVVLVPLDEAVRHTLEHNVFPLSQAPGADATQRLINNEQVDAILAQHRPVLLKVFKKFVLRKLGTQELVRLADFMQLARQAQIVAPGRFTAREVRTAFADARGGMVDGEALDSVEMTSVNFSEFLECLCRCAISKYVTTVHESLLHVHEAAVLIAELIGDVCKAYQTGLLRPSGGGQGRPAAPPPSSRPTTTTTVKLVPINGGESP